MIQKSNCKQIIKSLFTLGSAIGIASSLLSYRTMALTVTSVTLDGPMKIAKGQGGKFNFTVMGTASPAGEFFYWSVYDEDIIFDDVLVDPTIEIVTGDPAGGNRFTFNGMFTLLCSSSGEVLGPDGASGETEAEVYLLIEDDFGFDLGRADKIVMCAMKMRDKRQAHWSGDQSGDAQLAFNPTTETLSFGNMAVTPTLKLSDSSDSIADPLEGATIQIGDSTLLGVDIEQGWFFSDTILEYLVDGVPVLTADLVNGFLFEGGGVEPAFDSELQYDLTNISINNFINSPYLDSLQSYTDSGNLSFVSFYSNILTSSNDLTISSSSTGEVSVDGKQVPEPSSTLSLLSLGIVGAGATLKRKVKRSHSVEKEPTSIG